MRRPYDTTALFDQPALIRDIVTSLEARGVSAASLARDAGIAPSTLHRVMNGAGAGVEVVAQICTAAGLDPGLYFPRASDPGWAEIEPRTVAVAGVATGPGGSGLVTFRPLAGGVDQYLVDIAGEQTAKVHLDRRLLLLAPLVRGVSIGGAAWHSTGGVLLEVHGVSTGNRFETATGRKSWLTTIATLLMARRAGQATGEGETHG